MKPKIIQLSGYKRSGKDHTAKLMKCVLESQGYSVDIMSYAQPMKEIISTIFDISLEQLDEFKNNPEQYSISINNSNCVVHNIHDIGSWYETNFRRILQLFGSEAMKTQFGDSVWADLMLTKISQSSADYIIIPDCRFLVEINTVGGTIVRVMNDSITLDTSHASETELNDYDFDYYLCNDNYTLTTEDILEFTDTLN